MILTPVDKPLAASHQTDIPDLIHMTGPSSYNYMFGADRTAFDLYFKAAWLDADNYFAHNLATLAIDGDKLLGIELGHTGYTREKLKTGMINVAGALLGAGKVKPETLIEISDRSDKASYLNPYVPLDAYYLLALAVPVASRGQKIGAALMDNLITRARQAGHREVHLDVLSDNPAVNFYQAHGFACMAETVAPIPCRNHHVPMEMRMVLPL